MRVFALAVGAAMLAAALFAATQVTADPRFEKSLHMLAPEERLEQLCDYTAMKQIRRDQKQFRPDRAVANAMADPRIAQHTIEAKGAAFRSRGKWYALTFSCTASPDHMEVVSFRYTIGAEIPESKWAAFNLWQ